MSQIAVIPIFSDGFSLFFLKIWTFSGLLLSIAWQLCMYLAEELEW